MSEQSSKGRETRRVGRGRGRGGERSRPPQQVRDERPPEPAEAFRLPLSAGPARRPSGRPVNTNVSKDKEEEVEVEDAPLTTTTTTTVASGGGGDEDGLEEEKTKEDAEPQSRPPPPSSAWGAARTQKIIDEARGQVIKAKPLDRGPRVAPISYSEPGVPNRSGADAAAVGEARGHAKTLSEMEEGGMAAAVVVGDRTYYGASTAMYHPGHAYLKRGSGMDGDPREHDDVHPDVAAAYKRVPSKDRSDFHRHCAEVEALSNAVKDGADLSQAHVASVSAMRPGDKSKEKRRDMKGLKVTAPCSSCKHVLENWRPNRKPPPGGGSSSGAAGGGGFSTMSGVN